MSNLFIIETRGEYRLAKDFRMGKYVVVNKAGKMVGWGVNQAQAFGILQEKAGY